MSEIKILSSWHNESYDVRILHVGSTDPKRTLRNDLFWYSGAQIPAQWHVGDVVTEEEFIKHKVYKMRTFNSWDDIPNDCAMDIV